jgi:predicted nucleotidyltransferase
MILFGYNRLNNPPQPVFYSPLYALKIIPLNPLSHARNLSFGLKKCGKIAYLLRSKGNPNMPLPIEIPEAEIAAICRRYSIRKLALFGSVLSPNFRPDSDVDVLVEFEPDHTPGLAFFDIQDQLTELLGRKVDLHTPAFLSKYFRRQVLETAQVHYVSR